MNYKTLQLSGITRKEYPTLHLVLFEYHLHFVLALTTAWFIFFVINLKKRYLNYQLAQLCMLILVSGFSSVSGPSMA